MDWLLQVGTQVPVPVITVLMIYYGRLVTRAQHQFVVKQMEYWREIAVTNEKTMGTQSETIRTFTESAELQKRIMEAVQQAREKQGEHS